MKKIFSLTLCLALIFSLGTAALAADTDFVRSADITYRGISIIVNDVKIVPQDASGNAVEPFIMDGTTYLPVRAIAGALGLDVSWDAASSTVILKSGFPLNYGSGSALASYSTQNVDITFRDIKITLDGYELIPTNAAGEIVEPFILNGTTYLPVRGIANALGADVEWDGAASTVRLTAAAGEGLGDNHDGSYYVVTKSTQILVDENGETPLGVTVYDYYPNGLEHTVLSESDGTWQRATHYYSDDGLLIRTECEGYTPGDTTYTYDASRQLIREVSTGAFSYVKDYAYDSAGNITMYKAVYSEKDTIDISYTYNSLGLESRRKEVQVNDGWLTITVTTSTYDDAGHLIKEVSDYSGTSYPSTETATTTFSYDGGLLITRNDATGSTKYTYNSDGLLIGEYYYPSNGELMSSIEYGYDSAQNLIRYAYHSYYLDYTSIITYEYALINAV